MRFRRVVVLFSMALLLAVVSACDSSNEETATTEAPQPTDPPATEVVETAEAEVTDEIEVTEEATAESTANVDLSTEEPFSETKEPSVSEEPEATATQEVTPVSNISLNGDFSFNVFDVRDGYTSTLIADPPAGVKWVLLDLVLNNESSNTITVGESALIAVDRAGNRYQPEPPSDVTQPPLVGAEIPDGERMRGFVIFGLPTNQGVTEIQWCPASRCTQPLTLPLELEG